MRFNNRSKEALSFVLVLFITCCQAQDLPSKYAETIQADDLKKHLTYIASDELEGRDTGSEGGRKAADYIAKHFEKLGLQPIVQTADGSKSYFQKFNLYKKGWKDVYVKIGKQPKAELFKDFFPNGIVNIPEEQSMPVIFVGYGIEADKYNDYEKLDVKDKAVVFFEGEPKDESGIYRLTETGKKSDWYDNVGLQKKINIARDKGAKFFFMIADSDPEQFKTRVAERRAMLSRFSRMDFKAQATEKNSANAAFITSNNLAAEMLGVSESQLNKLKEKITSKGKTTAGSIKESNIAFKSERSDQQIQTQNVMGFLEGSDKKDEVVLITAHYDHVGKNEKGIIYNGADDDGTGTCSVLELAEAFAKAKADGHGPRRSILFMTVTGEEKGLLGSQYFTDYQPIIPLEKIVCDLNIDMIGRIDKEHAPNQEYVYVIGADKLSSELDKIITTTNENSIKYKLDYTYNDPKDPNRFYYRSDHYNFAKHKIPVTFFFSGVHEDYHQPGDDVEKILFPKYQQIARLVFLSAWELSNREERIKVDSNKP